jgi:hypothetical protein
MHFGSLAAFYFTAKKKKKIGFIEIQFVCEATEH